MGRRRWFRRRTRGAHAVPASNHKGSEVIHRIAVCIAVPALGLTAYLVTHLSASSALISYWIFVTALVGLCLLAFVKGRKFVNYPIARGRTLAIIPAYNEPQDKLYACVRSLLAQTVKPDKIIVIDDGSAEPVVPFDAPGVEWIRQPNAGKRGAHVTALRRFRRAEFQFVMTVDSDSTPYPDALEHLLRAMSNKRVQAATGWIYVRNYRESLVARAADMDIGSSCVMMRASRSMLGALETTSGALALYRSEILYDNLAAYAAECGTGDDRWLTLRALLRGQVVGVYEAGVETDMPANLRGTFRQRLRWSRSWWWMLPFAYARLQWKQLISPTVGLIEMVITPIVLLWAAVAWSVGFQLRFTHPGALLAFLGAYVVVRITQSVLYLAGRPGMSIRQKTLSLLIGTPVAAVLSLTLLVPTRYYALTRLRDNRWQTRQVKPASEPRFKAEAEAA
jgi:hyaluronan synthase